MWDTLNGLYNYEAKHYGPETEECKLMTGLLVYSLYVTSLTYEAKVELLSKLITSLVLSPSLLFLFA